MKDYESMLLDYSLEPELTQTMAEELNQFNLLIILLKQSFIQNI